MRLTDIFNQIVHHIDRRLPEALEEARLALLQRKPHLIALVGKHIKPEAATWYLSVLVARDSDEISASVNIQTAPDRIDVSADVSHEATVLWEAHRTFSTFDHSDEQVLDSLLSDFGDSATDRIIIGLGESGSAE